MTPVIISGLVGVGVGFILALIAVWFGFRRGIEAKHPELLQKSKPTGKVETSTFSPIAR